LDAEGLPQADSLQSPPERWTLRRLGAAGAFRRRASGILQTFALNAADTGQTNDQNSKFSMLHELKPKGGASPLRRWPAPGRPVAARQFGSGHQPRTIVRSRQVCLLPFHGPPLGKRRIPLPLDAAIDDEVDLGVTRGVQGQVARLNANLPGMDNVTGESHGEAASHVCPYVPPVFLVWNTACLARPPQSERVEKFRPVWPRCVTKYSYCFIIVGRPIMAAAAFPGGGTRRKAGPQAEMPAPLNARLSLLYMSSVNDTHMFLCN